MGEPVSNEPKDPVDLMYQVVAAMVDRPTPCSPASSSPLVPVSCSAWTSPLRATAR
jgi:hypothetical protein